MNWIRIDDELPPDGEFVLFCDVLNGRQWVGNWSHGWKWFTYVHPDKDSPGTICDKEREPTHWQPLPELPIPLAPG